MLKPLLLIDGDQFIYKATAALEKEIRWDEQNHVLYSNSEECWANLTGMINRIFVRFGSREHVLCFSSSPGFRSKIDSTYKAGRVSRKPLCYAALLERVKTTYKCVWKPALEADDVMGILATKPGTKRQTIIVSQDKDMKSIPGTLWTGEDVLEVTEAEADYFHLYQTLIGDITDGYKGCPGVGPKKAEAVLGPEDGETEPWISAGHVFKTCVVPVFEKAGLTEADALTQARLARILRWSDWDGEKQEPILWTP